MEKKIHYPLMLHISPDNSFIEFMCYPAVFCQSTESYFMQKFVPLLSKISVKPLENAFFIDKKLQSNTEVIFINRTNFIILFVKERTQNFFSAVASVNTTTATNLKLLEQRNFIFALVLIITLIENFTLNRKS